MLNNFIEFIEAYCTSLNLLCVLGSHNRLEVLWVQEWMDYRRPLRTFPCVLYFTVCNVGGQVNIVQYVYTVSILWPGVSAELYALTTLIEYKILMWNEGTNCNLL